MSKEKTKAQQEAENQAREVWDSWIVDLEDKEQPETCDVHDETCDNSGS